MSTIKRKFVDQDTSVVIDKYFNKSCTEDLDFLCTNRKLCSENTSTLGSLSDINKMCLEIKDLNKCKDDIDVCTVSANNLITDDPKVVNTSFLNIIIPIPTAFDDDANQKFLRLPPLSSSKEPGTKNLCNSCACFERFGMSVGSSGPDAKYTAEGQKECIFENFEYYYYPLEMENVTNTLNNQLGIYLGGSLVLPKNIIFANNNEDLEVGNLYDILVNKGISAKTAFNFITQKLWKNNTEKELQLKMHIRDKKEHEILDGEKLKFSKDMISFYVIFIVFLILVIFNLRI